MRRVVALLFLCAAGWVDAQQQISNAERVENWKADLRFFADTLRGNPIPGEKSLSGQKDFAKLYPHFDADLAALEADLPNLRNGAIYWRLAKIYSSAHVAHNSIFPSDPQMLPLAFEWVEDGPVVTAASSEYRSVIGTRLLSIGGLSSPEFLEAVSPYLAYETEGWRRVLAVAAMRRRALLELLDRVQDGKVNLTFEGSNGAVAIAVSFAPSDTSLVSLWEARNLPAPLVEGQQGYYWRQLLADSQTLYIQYNVCADDPKLKFSDFVSQTFAVVDESKPRRVVVDLRFNRGGNSAIVKPLTTGLASRRKTIGTPLILIGPQTFSSGVWAARDLRDKANGRLVGTATGGLVGGYGEAPGRKFPHFQLGMQWTTKYFPHPEPVSPDIKVVTTAEDLRVGRDPVLEAAIGAPR
jgi:hypothetical protein